MRGFRLDKWYFDVTTPAGDVRIGYAAKLQLGPVRLRYGSWIARDAGEPVARQRQALSFGRIDETPGRVAWENRGLGVRGTWTGGSACAPVVVVDGPEGRIAWNCLAFDAETTVDGGSADVVAGTGYAEHLSCTVAPWRMPFDELRWGRFIAADRSAYVAWIDLRGATTRTWVLTSDGPTGGVVSDDAVRVEGVGDLALLPWQPIRTENVARTLLGRWQWLSFVFPRRMRRILEDKRVGAGRWTAGERIAEGMAIHEVVRWT